MPNSQIAEDETISLYQPAIRPRRIIGFGLSSVPRTNWINPRRLPRLMHWWM